MKTPSFIKTVCNRTSARRRRVEGLGRGVNHRARCRTPAALTRAASLRIGVKEVVTLSGKSKMCGTAVLYTTAKASKTESMALMKCTPMALENGYRALAYRVGRGPVCPTLLRTSRFCPHAYRVPVWYSRHTIVGLRRWW